MRESFLSFLSFLGLGGGLVISTSMASVAAGAGDEDEAVVASVVPVSGSIGAFEEAPTPALGCPCSARSAEMALKRAVFFDPGPLRLSDFLRVREGKPRIALVREDLPLAVDFASSAASSDRPESRPAGIPDLGSPGSGFPVSAIAGVPGAEVDGPGWDLGSFPFVFFLLFAIFTERQRFGASLFRAS